jgi:hypothetical protein
MAETNPELQAKLQELDHELEEGDITQKGSVALSSSSTIDIKTRGRGRIPRVR